MSFSCFDNSNYDYNALNNKPCVNGCVLSGDMSFEDMGLTDLVNCCTQAYIDECFMPQVECCLSCKQNILTEGLGISILDQGETCQVSVAADSSLDCASENAVMNCVVAAETDCLRHDLACSVCCLEANKQDKLEAGNAINITCCRISVCVDSLMSSTSENPVMNCTINNAIDCIMSCGYQAGNGIDMKTDECGNHVISLSECVNVCCDLKVAGCTELNGALLVCGDIYQCGSAYCTHAEEVYSKCDCIFLRDGAVSPLGANECSGFVAKKYNGTDDAIIAVDSNGTWRLGETDGDPRQAVATRAEAQDMLDCGIAVWNGAAQCFETASSSDGQTATWDDCLLPGLSRSLSVNHTKIKGEVTNADKVTMHDYKSFSDLDADIALETGEFSRYDNVAGVSCCFQQCNVHRNCWSQLDDCVQYVEQRPVAVDPGDTVARYEFSFNEAAGTVDVMCADDGDVLLGSLSCKLWNGICCFDGCNVWTDGCCTYYSGGSCQYVLNKATGCWECKTWNGDCNFYGSQIFCFEGCILRSPYVFSTENCQYFTLNKATSTWESHTWNGCCKFIGTYLFWTDGCCLYSSDIDTTGWNSYACNYEFNCVTSTWTCATWGGCDLCIRGNDIWTDGCCIYYSSGTNQYVFNKSARCWECKTWNGCCSFYGFHIWTDGCCIYYSYGTDQYVLDNATSTWTCKTWSGVCSFYGASVWTDSSYAYYSCCACQYMFDKTCCVNSMFTSVSAASGCQSPMLLAGYPATCDDELEAYTATATNSQRRVATFKYEPNTSGSCVAGCYSSSNYTDLPFFVEHCIQNLCYYIDDLGVFCDQCQYYCYDSDTFTYCNIAVTSGTYIPGTYYFQCVASSSSCVCSSDIMFDGSPVSGSVINNSGSLPGNYSFCVCCQEQVTGETCCMSADTLCCLWDKTHSISEIEAYVVEQTVRLDVCESGNGRDYLVHTYGLSGCYLEQTRTYMSDTATRHCCRCLNNAEWTDWTDLSRQSAHVGTPRFLQFDFGDPNRKSVVLKADTHIPLKIRNSRTGKVTETRWLDIEQDTSYDLSAKMQAAAAVATERPGETYGRTFWLYLAPNAQGGIELVVSTKRDYPSDIDPSYTKWNTLLIGSVDTLCWDADGEIPSTVVRCYDIAVGAYSVGDCVQTKTYSLYDPAEAAYAKFYTRQIQSIDTTCTACPYAVATMDLAIACFKQGDILPEAIWSCGFYPDACCWGGMAYVQGPGTAMDIYTQSGCRQETKSVMLGCVVCVRSPMNFCVDQMCVGKCLMDYQEFMAAAEGSPSKVTQCYNHFGCGCTTQMPCNTGGNCASNCQRIVSDIGVEDLVGTGWIVSRMMGGCHCVWAAADGRGCLGQNYGVPIVQTFGGTRIDNTCVGPRTSDSYFRLSNTDANLNTRGTARVVCRTTFPT